MEVKNQEESSPPDKRIKLCESIGGSILQVANAVNYWETEGLITLSDKNGVAQLLADALKGLQDILAIDIEEELELLELEQHLRDTAHLTTVDLELREKLRQLLNEGLKGKQECQ